MLDLGSLRLGIKVDGEAAKDSLHKFGKSAKKVSGHIKDGLVKSAKVAATGLAAVGTAAVAVAESTREYRTEQGKLQTAFEDAGFSANAAKDTYMKLNGVLGDSGQSVEAANHLAKLANNEEDLAKWTNICTGVYGTFGDSIPIEGLTEAANETAKVGQLTGSLADALNWAGVNEDDFNAKLEKLTTEQERQKFITETLNGLYSDAADKYKENAKDVIAANEAQAKLTDTMAEFGAVAEPIITETKTMLADALIQIMPSLKKIVQNVMPVLISLVEKLLPPLMQIVDSILPFLTELINKLLPPIKSIIEAVIPVLLKLLDMLLPPIIQIVDLILPLLISLVQALTPVLMPILELLQPLINLLMVLIEPLLEILNMILPPLIAILESLIQVIVEVLQPVIETIASIITTVLNAAFASIMPIVKAVVKALHGDWVGAKQDLSNIWGSIKKLASDTWNGIKKTVADALENIVKKIKNIGSDMFDAGRNMFNNLWDGIRQVWEDIADWVREKIEWVKEKFASVRRSSSRSDGGYRSGRGGGSHRNGLNEVPYDGYIAELHKGEMVLTAAEADRYEDDFTGGKVINNVTVNNYSPKALDEATSARLYRQSQRQLALGF